MARVVGFASAYAREPFARFFYTDAYDPGRGGIYDARETRHVVDINLGGIGIQNTKVDYRRESFIAMDEESFSHLKKVVQYNTGDADRIEEEFRQKAFD